MLNLRCFLKYYSNFALKSDTNYRCWLVVNVKNQSSIIGIADEEVISGFLQIPPRDGHPCFGL